MSNFLRELQRRNVIKAAITYAVVSWAMLQVFDIIFPILDIPSSTLRYALYVLIAGFPLWLIFAYIFEWTPEGFKKTQDVAEETSVSRETGKKLNTLILVGLSVAVILLFVDRFVGFSLPSSSEKKSIAVLPFENLSGDQDAYFAAGVAEDILTHLSKVGDLRVLSRFTVRDYDTKGKTVQQIGKELGVSFLLTGSIRKEGEQIRISCQLVQVNPEEEAWAENFDKRMEDVFAIQSNVAQQVALGLKAKLTPDEKALIAKKPTESLEAYNLYLQGNNLQYNSAQDNENAIKLYEKAIEIDPGFVLAKTRLLTAYSRSVSEYGVRKRSFYDTLFQMAKDLHETYPDIEETNIVLGYQYLIKSDYKNAKTHLTAALEKNENNSQALNTMGMLTRNEGRFDEAIPYFIKGLSIEPLRLQVYNYNIASCYHFLQMYDQALPYYQSVLDTKKSTIITKNMMGSIYGQRGEKDKVKEVINDLLEIEQNTLMFDRVVSLAFYYQLDESLLKHYVNKAIHRPDFDYHDNMNVVLAKASLLQRAGKSDSAKMILTKSYEARYSRHGDKNRGMFLAYAELQLMLGDKQKALEWLERIMEEESLLNFYSIKTNFLFRQLENEPSVKAWMTKMDKKAEAMRRELSGRDFAKDI